MDEISKQSWLGALLGVVIGVTIAIVGYLVAVGGHGSYGIVIFCLLPFLTGFSIAAVVRPKAILAACVGTVAILSAAILIVTKLEGYICVVMAASFMGVGMAVGAFAGYWLIGRAREQYRFGPTQKTLLLLLLPLLMLGAEHVERPFRSQQRIETFATEIEVEASPEETWNSLTQIPELSGPKPFLLAIGMPVPTSCSLSEQAVGAERVCRFDQGEIRQRITEWLPNTTLRVAITQSTLPGRQWLQFVDAHYELIPTPTGTTLSRYSSIGSRLYPRWYWRAFEEWAVGSEHIYVLENIKRIAESK